MDSTTIATGKRKSDDAFPHADADFDAAAPKNLFASLSDQNWNIISSFAAPPDVYSLSLSSVHFFREATDTATPDSDNKNAASAAKDKKVLATQLLRSSLMSSLGRVLEKSSSGITFDAVLKMGELPEGSALIAGSTIVAACLGKDWSNWPDSADVDVYCSAGAAPQVRSWLVEQANCMFVGVNDTYIDFVDNRLLYVVDTKIHHVEKWGSYAENWEHSREESESEYRRKTIQWGAGAVEYANWKWKHSMDFGILGVVPINDGRHDIKPRPGGNLPFDFTGSGSVDLIVAKTGIPTSSLLDSFDLEICKASFDGRKFHIPDPHLTFAGKTRMETNRRAVVSSYVKHHREPENFYPDDRMDYSRLASNTIRAVRRDVPNAPFYRLLDIAEALPDRYNPNAGFLARRGTIRDPAVLAKWGPPVQFHNWCCALIKRLRKYQKRGIDIVGAPSIVDDFKADRYHIKFHGG
eukprot:scaffold4012_cov127-Skeletonema_menzelii.AAC.2